MNRRLDRLLVEKHPLLFTGRFADKRHTCMCWGFECGDGWYRLLKEAADKLESLIGQWLDRTDGLAESPWQHPRASQVKEKYGTLRFYMDHSTDEMDAVTQEAERKSAKTCELCGKPGKVVGTNWLYCRCPRHAAKLRKEGRI